LKFNNKEHLLSYLRMLGNEIGMGSQGLVYLDEQRRKVYKIFHQFFDDYDPDLYTSYDAKEIKKFSKVANQTFVWSEDVIYVNDEVVGSVSRYVKGKNLYMIDPLQINLNKFVNGIEVVKKDIKTISEHGVLTYDIMYNTLYNNGKFYIVDHEEYNYSDCNLTSLIEKNTDNFNLEIMFFLIDNYFDEFISSSKLLSSMYGEKGMDVVIFINELKKLLSEYIGEEMNYLKQAKTYLNKRQLENPNYERILSRSVR